MTEVHITLYGNDAEWFEEQRERIAQRRDGNEPTNAELVRLLLQDASV